MEGYTYMKVTDKSREVCIYVRTGLSYYECKILTQLLNEPRHEISNNVVFATSKGSDQPAHMRSLIREFASRLNIL